MSGPGFLNITVSDQAVWGQVAARLASPRLGVGNPEDGRRTVIDYSAPNIAKEMHVGHLRTTIIGDSLARVLGFLGADVVATPVTSNSGIESAGRFRVLRTRVGSPFVIAAMNEAVAAGARAVVGFEANGGTLTATSFDVNGKLLAPLPTRDSFLPALAALALRGTRARTAHQRGLSTCCLIR